MKVRETATVVVVTAVDGKGVRTRRPRKASGANDLVVESITPAILDAAMKQADGQISRIRFVRDERSYGGWSSIVFNSPAQAKAWDRANR